MLLGGSSSPGRINGRHAEVVADTHQIPCGPSIVVVRDGNLGR